MFSGVDRADSIIINLHKGLFQPFGNAAVLFKKGNSSKLFDNSVAQKTESLRGNPVEDSSPFRGFPAWMFINILGLKHVKAALLEKVKLVDFLYSYLKLCPGVSVPLKPELSKILFALEDKDVETANRKTESFCKDLTKDGHFLFDTTKTDGRVYIHICISAFRTHLSDLEAVLRKLKIEVS